MAERLVIMVTLMAHADITHGGQIRMDMLGSAETGIHIPKETKVSMLWATAQKNAAWPLPLIDPL
jgi:hypothetical protein